jgi:hypothetical protein
MAVANKKTKYVGNCAKIFLNGFSITGTVSWAKIAKQPLYLA